MLVYLIDRFRSDATTLRERAAALRGGPPRPGPHAAMSHQMASACDDVIAMLDAVPAGDPRPTIVAALTALIPLLERRAAASSAPPVRSVFIGAATRIREVIEAERRHEQTNGAATDRKGHPVVDLAAAADDPDVETDDDLDDDADDDADDDSDDDSDVDDDDLDAPFDPDGGNGGRRNGDAGR